MPKRLQEFDIIRVVATFAVVGIHISAGYVLLSPAGYACNQVVRFAVPLFIIISGYLLFNADLNHSPVAVPVFFRKRFTRVVWPYILWTVFYFLLGLFFSGAGAGFRDLASLLLDHLLWGTAYYHLYFVIIMIQLYLLYPFLRSSFKKYPQGWLLFSLLLTLASQAALYLDMMHIIILPRHLEKLYLVAFPVWIFFFVLGMYSALRRQEMEKVLRTHFTVIVTAWLASLFILFADSKLTATYASSIRPSAILYTVCTYFLLYGLALKVSRPCGQWVFWISRQSFLVYLMHPTFLTLLLLGAPRLGLPGLWQGAAGMVMLYCATVLLTFAATYVVSLTPAAAWLGGERNAGKNR